MDRRKFLSGVGTVGAVGAVATGIAIRESNEAAKRGRGLAQVAGAGRAAGPASVEPKVRALQAESLTLAYLRGSAGIFASPATEAPRLESATGLHWSRWDGATTTQANQSAIHSLFKVSSMVTISIGALRTADSATASRLSSLDITAHFAIDDAPYFASFVAWRYEDARKSARTASSRFVARVPDRVALDVRYAFDPSAMLIGTASAGNLYLPLGAGPAPGGGLATGLYALATPSVRTGVQPAMSDYVFSGDLHAPLADPSGRPLDFDYLTLAIRPVAV